MNKVAQRPAATRQPQGSGGNTTAFAPAGKRNLWHGLVRCRECRAAHLIEAPDRDGLTGLKTTPCGKVWITIDLVIFAAEQVRRAA